jgi:hypothetical protein
MLRYTLGGWYRTFGSPLTPKGGRLASETSSMELLELRLSLWMHVTWLWQILAIVLSWFFRTYWASLSIL